MPAAVRFLSRATLTLELHGYQPPAALVRTAIPLLLSVRDPMIAWYSGESNQPRAASFDANFNTTVT